MRKEDFRQWLDGKIKKKPISDCISRCTTVEYALKVDLDEEYRKDNGQAVIAKLSYNARDAKANLPVPQEFNFKEGCNVVQRLTDLRSSVNRYFDFCKNLTRKSEAVSCNAFGQRETRVQKLS